MCEREGIWTLGVVILWGESSGELSTTIDNWANAENMPPLK